MSEFESAHTILRKGTWNKATDRVVLTYEDRFLRRKVLKTTRNLSFLVDLDRTSSLDDGDALKLNDGTVVQVVAAQEPLLEVTGADLPRLAWHVGNRHTPCQIENERLLVQQDHVIADMLDQIGAQTRKVVEVFLPEGGAYGHGRTHGHDHSHEHVPANNQAAANTETKHRSHHGHNHGHADVKDHSH